MRRALILIAGAGVVAAVVLWAPRRALRPTRLRHGRPPTGDLRLTVVLPAFNEAGRIADTIEEIRTVVGAEVGSDYEIIVVDDGSTDRTAADATGAGADLVLTHAGNRGKGAAVRTGVAASRGRAVVFTDADQAYSADHLLDLLGAVEAGGDMVAGSRTHEDTTTVVAARPLRRAGGRLINQATHLVLDGDYGDTQCGLKGFEGDAGRVLFAHSTVDGFAFDVELFHLAERYGLSVVERPVRVVNSSHSSVRVVRDGLRLLRDLLHIRLLARQGAYDLNPDELRTLGLVSPGPEPAGRPTTIRGR